MGLAGILVALILLIWLAYRGGSILLLAPAAALVAAAVSREPLLAHWTQTFMVPKLSKQSRVLPSRQAALAGLRNRSIASAIGCRCGRGRRRLTARVTVIAFGEAFGSVGINIAARAFENDDLRKHVVPGVYKTSGHNGHWYNHWKTA